ncbi:DUF3301 domain-containing protein [Marinobacterium lutimaris]|uniref:DUF3301 domain-containing protein n=1 Tax=Marinobacterium lutimaris TaxID=568106 RepID=A0A1H5W638_9GAMM|nr:DUF3301 domain-containing protein [Marinobacterium lutimaris]SEF94631.1 Protein of unknown function [Marinobacterium lutimaris]
MLELKDLFWLFLTGCLCLIWWQGQKVREIALREVRRQCEKMDLQLLDESVGLRALWLKRADDGKIRVWRRYHFEFTSTGDERYSGEIITLGHKVTGFNVSPHRIG